MEKIVIAGVEGSGKTVLMASFASEYERPDNGGYFLSPQDARTLAFYRGIVASMRAGAWPSATPATSAEAMRWTLCWKVGDMVDNIRELEFLDYGGEVYRAAFGMPGDGSVPASAVESLRGSICGAGWLVVLVNLRDVINGNPADPRCIEASWLPKGIIDFATGDAAIPQGRIVIALTQADAYSATIAEEGGARGALEKYLPHVASVYGGIDVFAVSAVNRVLPNADGIPVPAPDFGTDGLEMMMSWLSKRGVLRALWSVLRLWAARIYRTVVSLPVVRVVASRLADLVDMLLHRGVDSRGD